MTTNDIIVIILLTCAVMDTIGAKFLLPGMLQKNPLLDTKKKKQIIGIVNIGSLAFFVTAVLMFLLKPFE